MRTAILGWPQVGKSALFKMLCGPRVHAETYGLHLGVARVPDERLEELARVHQARKTTFATIEFMDAPPLTGDPEKDAAVFGQVRGAQAFAFVARVFGEDVDPRREVAQLETEFLVADLDTVSKRLEKVERDLKKSHSPELEQELAVLQKARESLAGETPLRALELSAAEQHCLRGFMLLSGKPLLIVLNAGDDAAPELPTLPEKYQVSGLAREGQVALTEVCGQIESELVELEPAEAAEFLASYGLKESARDRVLHTVCRLLGLLTFFTVSEPECRAWLAPSGTAAIEAAGMVHSDFAERFVKAEVVPWQALVECGSLAAAREQGKILLEGKEYRVAEGDVLYIRHTA